MNEIPLSLLVKQRMRFLEKALLESLIKVQCHCGCALDLADAKLDDRTRTLSITTHPCKDCLGTAERNAREE